MVHNENCAENNLHLSACTNTYYLVYYFDSSLFVFIIHLLIRHFTEASVVIIIPNSFLLECKLTAGILFLELFKLLFQAFNKTVFTIITRKHPIYTLSINISHPQYIDSSFHYIYCLTVVLGVISWSIKIIVPTTNPRIPF